MKPWRVVSRTDHPCKVPGAWRRVREGLGYGSVIRCKECGARWTFTRTADFGLWVRT